MAKKKIEEPKVAQAAGLVQIKVTCVGITPLIMNRMSMETLLAIRERKKPAKTATRPAPREEADGKVHRLKDGRPYVPGGEALYKCFINAGQFVRLDGKRQISTAKATILPGMMTLLTDPVLLTQPGNGKLAEWEVDIRPGRNPNGGEAVCLVRPRFDEWQIEFTIEIDQGVMPVPMARELVDISGRRVGLFEGRPQKRGTNGMFKVECWEKVVPK